MKEKVTTARRRFRAACYAAQGSGQRRADIARTAPALTRPLAGPKRREA